MPDEGIGRKDPLSLAADVANTLDDHINIEVTQFNDSQDSSSVAEISTSDLADPNAGGSNHYITKSHGPISSPATNLIGSPVLESYNSDDPRVTLFESNGAHNSLLNGQNLRPELQRDKGGRTFTMRELLNELKDDKRQNPSQSLSEQENLSSPKSQDTFQNRQQYRDHNNVTMELINSVTGIDEEGRSHQRVLTFAARRFANAIERNPDDYDALYNWALVLQESADNVDPASSSPSKDSLLEEACAKYEEATNLCSTLHEAYYNWAIAISDRARIRGRTKEAEELWKQAIKKYEKAVQLNWNSPQALNNWGLALQELSAIVPAREKQIIIRTAISKFRAAIQLQFDFHRAIYNLGTLLYGLAEDTLRTGGSSNVLHSQCAIYIAAAHALKPTYSVYHSALKLVRSMLPLPYLKVGYLTAPPANVPVAPWCDWKTSQFVLNHESLRQVNDSEQKETGRPGDDIKVDITDIVCVSECADLTLPGRGLCIDTIHGEVYLLADSLETLDGWLDAIRLVYTIFALGKRDVLAG